MTAPVLALRDISHAYGSSPALEDVSLVVRAGTIHAVLGENGAGKSTLMRVAFGMLSPDRGSILIDGQERRFRSSRDARTAGLGMVHQHFSLVPGMTVAENVALGGRGLFSPTRAAARVRDVMTATGLTIDPNARVADLGVGAQQRVELLKALAGDARVLILDEPTAVLTPTETEELLVWIKHHAASGHAVILITHKLREALAVADDITVLRRGRVVTTVVNQALDETALVTAMTGEPPAAAPRARPALSETREVAVLRNVTVRDARGAPRLHEVGARFLAGEVVGVAGVEGSGVHELLRVLAGQARVVAGDVVRPDRIGFVPEDRQRDALIGALSLQENFALQGAGVRRGLMAWKRIAVRTAQVMAAHDVRAAGPEVRAETLSGGNQQKFVVGRELEGAPSLVIAENPVRGLDVKAAAHVMQALTEYARAGGCVVIYSSDVDDVLSMADRMLVVFDGRVTECPPDRARVARALVGL